MGGGSQRELIMRRKIIMAVIFIGLSASYFLISGPANVFTSQAATSGAPGTEAPAPDFTLTDMQGEAVSLSQYRGKVILLNFWAGWCPPCRAEMPSMEKLYRQLKDRDFVILAVNVEEGGRAAVQDFTREIPVSFPILLDTAQTVSRLYRVRGLPQSYIIDREGKIVQQVTGGMDWNSPDVVRFLSSLMKGA